MSIKVGRLLDKLRDYVGEDEARKDYLIVFKEVDECNHELGKYNLEYVEMRTGLEMGNWNLKTYLEVGLHKNKKPHVIQIKTERFRKSFFRWIEEYYIYIDETRIGVCYNKEQAREFKRNLIKLLNHGIGDSDV